MPKTLIFPVLYFISLSLCAQTEMAVEVIQPQTICVNSVSAWSGSTRRVIPIKLPENTVRWHYSFSASRNKVETDRVSSTFNLLSKLSYLIDQTGTTSSALSILGSPPGTDFCDVFLLMSAKEVAPFENKAAFSFHRQGTREGFVSGVVDISDPKMLTGWQYIGLRNNDFNDAVNVQIQVVAIVKLEVKTNGWTAAKKQTLYDAFKANISQGSGSSLSSEQIADICTCLMKNITSTYKPEDLSAYADYELNLIIKKIVSSCIKDLGIK